MEIPEKESERQRLLSSIMNGTPFEIGVVDGTSVCLEYWDGKFHLSVLQTIGNLSAIWAEKAFDKISTQIVFDWAEKAFELSKNIIDRMMSIGYKPTNIVNWFIRKTPAKSFVIWGEDKYGDNANVSASVYDSNGVMLKSRIYENTSLFDAAVKIEKETSTMEDFLYMNEKLRDLVVRS